MSGINQAAYRRRINNGVDTNLITDDGADSPYTSAGANITQVSSADNSVDLWDGNTTNVDAAINIPVKLVCNVSVVDDTTGDESYLLKLQQSADNSTWVDLAEIDMVDSAGDPAIGRYAVQALPTLRYVRQVLFLAGTTPSITTTSGFITDTTGTT